MPSECYDTYKSLFIGREDRMDTTESVIGSDMERMTDRIVADALAAARQRHEADELAGRVHRLCDDAATARRVAWMRREEWR